MDPRRLRRLWPAGTARVDDLLLAAGLAVFGVVGSVGAAGEQPTARPLDPAAWVLLLVAAWALLARRRRPAAVLGVTAAATVAWLAAGYPYGPMFLPLSVAVYTLAAATPRERLPALVGCVAGLLVVVVAIGVGDGRVPSSSSSPTRPAWPPPGHPGARRTVRRRTSGQRRRAMMMISSLAVDDEAGVAQEPRQRIGVEVEVVAGSP